MENQRTNLILAGYEIPVDILERSIFISQHSGRELEHIKVNTTIEGEKANERIIDFLGAAKKEGLNSKEGQITKKWKLTNNSYSYGDNKELVNYSMELEEMEEIKLDKLILDDLELIPYQYKEDFDSEEHLSAEVRVLLSEDQFKKVKELRERDSFTVIRVGINETPRQMHLRPNGWSKDERGIKCQFSLYDPKDTNDLSPFRTIWRAVNLVIKQEQLIEQLANLLVQKDILTKEEYESIKAGNPERNLDIEFELYQEKDLDEWEFS